MSADWVKSFTFIIMFYLSFFSCSFVSVAEPKGFLFSPGPTSASFAKSKIF